MCCLWMCFHRGLSRPFFSIRLVLHTTFSVSQWPLLGSLFLFHTLYFYPRLEMSSPQVTSLNQFGIQWSIHWHLCYGNNLAFISIFTDGRKNHIAGRVCVWCVCVRACVRACCVSLCVVSLSLCVVVCVGVCGVCVWVCVCGVWWCVCVCGVCVYVWFR